MRYDVQNIVSHDENAILSSPIDNSQTILLLHGDADVIGIDEAQFFDDQLPDVCDQLALKGISRNSGGVGYGFYRKTVWADPFPVIQSRLYNQAARHLRKMRQYCQLFLS